MRIGVRGAHLDTDATVVGDGHQRVDGVQFATRVVGVVHTGHSQAQLEQQLVAQRLGHRDQVIAAYLEGQLVAEHHDALDRGAELVGAEGRRQRVDDVVEVAAVGPG